MRWDEGGNLYAVTAIGDTDHLAKLALTHKLKTLTGPPIRKPKPVTDVDGVRIPTDLVTDIKKVMPETLVRDAVALWFESVNGDPTRRAQTRDAYRQVARQSFLKEYGATMVSVLDAGLVSRYFVLLAQTQPGLARSGRWILQQVLADAVRDKAITRNIVMDTVKIKHVSQEPPNVLKRPEDFQEVRRLVARWRDARSGLGGAQRDPSFILTDVIEILGGTGLRINELLGLRHSDVDFDAGTVAVCGTLVELKGLGLAFQPRTKTPSGMRTLALPQVALDALHRQATLNGHPEYIFSTGTGNFVNAHNLARSLREVRRGSRFGWPTLKSFRATVATWLKAKAGLAAA